jgi:hypothetical protein
MWNGSGRDPETGGGDARMAPPQALPSTTGYKGRIQSSWLQNCAGRRWSSSIFPSSLPPSFPPSLTCRSKMCCSLR